MALKRKRRGGEGLGADEGYCRGNSIAPYPSLLVVSASAPAGPQLHRRVREIDHP